MSGGTVIANGKTIKFTSAPGAHKANIPQVLIMIQPVDFARQDIEKGLELGVTSVPMEGFLFMGHGIVGILAPAVHTMTGARRLAHCVQKEDITNIGVRKMKMLAWLVLKENIQTTDEYVFTFFSHTSFHS